MTGVPEEFWFDTALPGDSDRAVRIVRDVEDRVEAALLAGDLVYVRGPRKSGKSTLARRLAHRIERRLADGKVRHVVRLNITNIGQHSDAKEFEHVLEKRQQEALEILAGTASGVRSTDSLGGTVDAHWFWHAVADLAKCAADPVVIFVDEIEELLGDYRKFGESWLVALRHAHQEAEGRLAVCVLGQLPRQLLVRSPQRTPFNSAKEFVLPDFDRQQVQELTAALGATFEGKDLGRLIARSIFNETAGQPNLTQHMLSRLQELREDDPESIADYALSIRDFVETDDECQPTTSNTYMGVDAAFVMPSNWAAAEALEIYARMIESAARVGTDAQPTVLYDPWSDGQLMLEAIGLAKVETRTDTSERYLVVRSRIVRRMFNHDWVQKRLLGLPSPSPDTAPSGGGPVLAEMERIAVEELLASDWAREHHASIKPGSGREMVENALFEFELVRARPTERTTLQMFKGVGTFGQRLWQRQVRTLRQMADRSEALPNIYRGGLLANGRVAYIITQRPSLTLAEPGIHDFIRDRRSWAVDQFTSLAEGLGCLAEDGIAHRNIWPGSIRMDAPVDSEPAQMKLAGFEFSVMLRSVLGTSSAARQTIDQHRMALQRAFLRQSAICRPHAPPEFLSGLFGEPDTAVPALVTSDIFSLGMMATGWFVGPHDAASFEAVLKEDEVPAIYSRTEHDRYIDAIGASIQRAVAEQRIPSILGRLLREMIAVEPNSRPTPTEVAETLKSSSAALRGWSTGERQPLLACYTYRQTAEQLSDFGLVTSALHSEDSRRDVEAFLERELRDATLFYAPRGVAPFLDSATDDHLSARWVLRGASWLFYCQRFERRSLSSRSGVVVPHVLRIAYPWPLQRAWRGVLPQSVALRDHGPLVIAEQHGSPQLDPSNDAKFQSWNAILAEASRRILPPSFEIAKTAFNWLVEAQREEFELQRFPMTAIGLSSGRSRAYILDETEYRRWASATPMRSAVFQASNITEPRDYFEQILQQAMGLGDRSLRLRPYKQDGGGRWSFAQLEGISAAGITISGVSLPQRVQLELRSAGYGRRPLDQQAEAIEELSASPKLFDQLLQPHVIIDHETIDDPRLDEPASRLAGRAGEIVRTIVASSPLVALQGPPGTGKTTVIAAVVQCLLLRDETQRILITSQSHAAVDNIALRIKELGLADGDRTVCVRVAAAEKFEDGETIDQQIKAWRTEDTAERLMLKLRRECKLRLAGSLEPGLQAAYRQLNQAATDGALEMADRIRESATLIFATTAGARRVARDGFLPHGRFDLAIVDEASKAWPTEIIQPMLIADRQFLVGDHRQLAAFGATSIQRLLQQCISSNRQEFQVLANHQPAVRAWLRLFESFFDTDKTSKFVASGEHDELPGWRDKRAVAERLDLQFRMRSDIADVVSSTFYDRELKSDPSVDARSRPDWLEEFAEEIGASRGVLWIDTRPDRLFRSASAVRNEDQAELAAKLLARATSLAGPKAAIGRLNAVVLSPYKQQNDEIEKRLALHNVFAGNVVRTVDSFQGQEADLVILSLVRGPGETRDAGSATRRYGFLVQPERVNVMFSRARDLLVVLGDFDFYADAARIDLMQKPKSPFDLSFWERLCGRISETGRVIDHNDLPDSLRIG